MADTGFPTRSKKTFQYDYHDEHIIIQMTETILGFVLKLLWALHPAMCDKRHHVSAHM